jgi:hypothetical protein
MLTASASSAAQSAIAEWLKRREFVCRTPA